MRDSVPTRLIFADRIFFSPQVCNPIGCGPLGSKHEVQTRTPKPLLGPITFAVRDDPEGLPDVDLQRFYSKHASQFTKPDGSVFHPVSINLQSSTGLYSGSATMKNSEMPGDTIMCVAQQFLATCNADINEIPQHPLMVQAMKPKAEVYSIAERFTKTRNIYALSAPVTILLNAVQHPIFKGRPHFKPEDLRLYSGVIPPGNYNLMGWSFADSFMDIVFTELPKGGDGTGIFFYADNLYIVVKRQGKVKWASLDGSKMECSHDGIDAQMYTDYILSHYDDVDETTARLYKEIAIEAMVHARVQIGKQRFRVDWLSSGYPDTAEINCLKMA